MNDQERAAQIAILRELLESGPYFIVWVGPGGAGFNRAVEKLRDHIPAKIQELEGAGG